MDFYQCDVFASGLVLWETTMRKNLPTKSNSLTFPGTTSTDVKMFFEIIQRCSSPKICIKSRSKAEDALFEVEELNKKFNTFIQKPYRDQNQKWIELPEGLCIETTTSGSTFMVPDGLSLEMGSVKRTKSTQVDPTIDATLQNQFNQWISKAERKSNFENLMGKLQDGEDILPVYFYNFLALPESIKCFDDEKFEDVDYKKAEAKRRTCEHMRAEGRCGLLLKLTLLDKGMSFWNKNFSLEDCCDRCMAEYVDLIYISLYELSDLLEVRQRFLRDRWIMKQTPMSVEVFQQIEVRKKQHIEEMEMGIEKFWKRRIIE
ncbi:unnamed protein product, partial [Mesorhabditis belari]|uniref:Uncharacterized protein n=1 Tax=Mesorhabditis belari TaxID=2138241 RepID=A0AAF3J565_9BILA